MSEYMNHSRCQVCNIKIPVKRDYCLKHLSFGQKKCGFINYSDKKPCITKIEGKNKYCDHHIEYFKNQRKNKKYVPVMQECAFVDD